MVCVDLQEADGNVAVIQEWTNGIGIVVRLLPRHRTEQNGVDPIESSFVIKAVRCSVKMQKGRQDGGHPTD